MSITPPTFHPPAGIPPLSDTYEAMPLREPTEPEMRTLLADDQIQRIDRNFLRLESVIIALQGKLKRPPRRRRSGSAARTNPDQWWFGMVIAGFNAAFILGAFIVQFGGQYGFAPRTQLPQELWWFIPLALDLPIVISAFTAAVYRRRKQNARANGNWVFVFGLSAFGSVIQMTHVFEAVGDRELTWPDFLGAFIMGAIPWITLYLSENLAGLLVKPTGEARDPAEPPVRRAPPKKRSTKR